MKRELLIMILSAVAVLCHSQEIELKFNMEKKDFETKSEKECFKYRQSYNVKITGINSAVIGYRIKSKSFVLTSQIPDILKSVLPGLTDKVVFDSNKDLSARTDSSNLLPDISTFYAESISRYEKLSVLKRMSDLLYDQTKTKADAGKACLVLRRIEDIFDVKSVNDLRQKVVLSSKYIFSILEIYKKNMTDNSTQRKIDEYIQLSFIADTLNSRNYISYVNFIENSVNAKDYIEYKPVKAEKDVVDLNITFTDKYTKDTVYNSSVSFYTYGNLSLDFSSGFFYNTIYEKQYYLDSITKSIAVLPEENPRFDVSIGALGNLCYKFSNYFKAGINMGIAVSPLDGKFRYLLGSSFMFGRKYQLGINMGLAMAKIKVLSGGVESKEDGYYLKPGVTTIPMYEKVQPGFYIGITYNLISTKK